MTGEPDGPLGVLIADDHAPMRLGLRATLEACDDFVVSAEAADADSAVALAVVHRPVVCLLDVDMPGDGIRAARELAVAVPDTTVVMLTVSDADEDLFSALRAGAAGYLLKGMAAERIPEAIRGALGGEAALSRRLVARLVDEYRSNGARRVVLPTGRTATLTEREWRVCSLLLRGDTTAQVAGDLHVSPVTVRRHVSDVVRKLRAANRDEALAWLADALAGERDVRTVHGRSRG